MFTRRAFRCITLLAACLFWLPAVAFAEEEPPKAEEEGSTVEGLRCVSSRPIRRTEVIDDQNILFYLRGATIYLNHLPKPCKRLSQEGRFMYRTTVARLCKYDHITVLSDSGMGVTSGPTCKLGRFYALTKEDVENLKNPPGLEAKPIPPAEPEEPGTANSEQAEASEPEQN